VLQPRRWQQQLWILWQTDCLEAALALQALLLLPLLSVLLLHALLLPLPPLLSLPPVRPPLHPPPGYPESLSLHLQ
jgi:hypothetical protein